MLLGESAAMQTIHTTIYQLTNNSKIPVLIIGETGVGKEWVVQTIHFEGPWTSKSLANVLPQISQVQFMNTGYAKNGIRFATFGRFPPKSLPKVAQLLSRIRCLSVPLIKK